MPDCTRERFTSCGETRMLRRRRNCTSRHVTLHFKLGPTYRPMISGAKRVSLEYAACRRMQASRRTLARWARQCTPSGTPDSERHSEWLSTPADGRARSRLALRLCVLRRFEPSYRTSGFQLLPRLVRYTPLASVGRVEDANLKGRQLLLRMVRVHLIEIVRAVFAHCR